MLSARTFNVSTPNDLEIQMTRTFDAPKNLVWQAMSKPDLIKRWLMGPPGWQLVTCDNDPRVGGTFHWVWRGPDNQQFSMRGVHREVVPNQRMTRTEIFDMPGCAPHMAEQLATLELTETAGRTHLTLTVAYTTKQARDAALASGMEHGVSAGYDRLDHLLADGTLAPST